MSTYFCCDERRREAVRATGAGNGIDFLEVVDGPGVPPADRQRLLRLHFINPPGPELQQLRPADVHIIGGMRVTGVTVVPPLAWGGDVLVVRVDRTGDFSPYTLRLGDPDGNPAAGLDARLSAVDFSFKLECPTGFDCGNGCSGQCMAHADPADEPDIDYLALDYASFRQLMLDRMALTAPDWTERSPADLGVALVELLAYAADHVAYQLDATGMESTLATARRRTSVRRHARMVDYRVDDGSNARTWVHFEIADGAGGVTLPAGTQLLSQVPGLPRILVYPSPDYTQALAAAPVVFETMQTRVLRDSLNRFELYAWGDRECCLPAGATTATLRGRHEDLRTGDVLVFVEQRGPRTGSPADADLAHRHAVRLIRDPAFTTDPLGGWFDEPTQPPSPLDVTEIEWAAADALPFAVCISAVDDEGTFHDDVTTVLGNIVLADHGRSMVEDLQVPEPDPRLAIPATAAGCERGEPEGRAPRWNPQLAEPNITMAGTTGRTLPGSNVRRPPAFDPAAPAAAAMNWQARDVLPDILLTGPDEVWNVRHDLLASDAFAPEFVVETETDGIARLRFGDGEYGLLPRPGTTLTAHYRTGNGTAGNIGADALWHLVAPTGAAGVTALTNPLPAVGGREPEPLDRVRQDAPAAFRIQERAVTAADYAEVAQRHPEVQQAVCTERWTGSWRTMFLSVDRRDGLPVDAAFEQVLRTHLERFRMAGHDLEISPPRLVALDVSLEVCVLPAYYRSDVRQELLSVLGSGLTAGGSRGLFHPDNFTFGTPVYLSAVLAAVQAVPGVRYVNPLLFRRLAESNRTAARTALEQGVLRFTALEIPRLDNDPNFPERGTLTLEMEGGR